MIKLQYSHLKKYYEEGVRITLLPVAIASADGNFRFFGTVRDREKDEDFYSSLPPTQYREIVSLIGLSKIVKSHTTTKEGN